MLTRRNDVEYRANDSDDDDESSSSDSDSESSEEESDSSFGDEYEYENEPEATTPGKLRDLSDLSNDATDGVKKTYMQWTTNRLLRFLNDAQQPIITAEDFPNFDHERLKATNRLGISKLWSIMQKAGVVETPPEDEKVVCEAPKAFIDGKQVNGKRYESPYLTFTASGKNSSRTGRGKYHVSGTKKRPTDLEKYRKKCEIAKKFYKSRHDAK